MLLQSLRCLAMSVLLPAFPALLLAANGAELPKSATPRLAVVSNISETAGTITCCSVVMRPVWETRTVEKDGRTSTYQVVKLIPESRSATFSLAKAAFHDAQGNEVSREMFEHRIRSGDAILVSEDGKPVDQAYLRILKSDILILVPPEEELTSGLRRMPSIPPSSAPVLPPAAPPSPAPR